MSAALYLYAVIDSAQERNLGPVGVGDPPADVRVLPVHGFGVVCSEVADSGHALTVSDVRTHQALLARLMEEHTVLPFSFATAAAGREAVDLLVARGAADISARLLQLRGRAEVGLKVFWNREAMQREVQPGGGAERPPQSQLSQAERYNRAIRVGQAVEARVRQWQDLYVPRMTAVLAPLCEDIAHGPIVAPTMLWNASFLIVRSGERAFRDAVDRLDRRFGRRLDFRYAGPLPPYSFVNLRFGAAEEDA